MLEEHPEKKICVIDSKSTAGVMVLLVRRAQKLIESSDDPDFEAICEALRVYQASLRTVFTLECFDNLIKNGRMRPLVGSLLHTLGIHVIADATPQGTIHVGVLLDQQHGDALPVDLPDDGENVLHHQRRKAQRGLVQHHQPGFCHQRAAHGQHLLFATGKRAGNLAAALGQPREAAVHVADRRGVLCRAAGVAAHLQVFFHRHLQKYTAPLRHL